MNAEQTQTLSLKAAYAFGAAHGLEREVTEIREKPIEWDRPYTSSLGKGYMVALFEDHGLFDTFKKEHWSSGNTPAGETRLRRYLRIKREYEAFLKNGGQEDEGGGESEQALKFPFEDHLRDFLAKNLDRIETGLRLYSNGVEFRVDGGWIDLLAVDRDEKFVVIELKVSHGRNRRSANCSTTWDGSISIWGRVSRVEASSSRVTSRRI